MRKEDLIKNDKSLNPKVISLSVHHLKKCLELDDIALNGLWSRREWERELTDSKRLCIGFFNNSELLAFACGWCVADELQITAVAVHPNYQQRGIGKIILSKLIFRARILGLEKATLEVKSSNSAAKALYRSLDFKYSGKRNKYYKDGSDALLLWRYLLSDQL